MQSSEESSSEIELKAPRNCPNEYNFDIYNG